ncbi:MAG: cellulase family glycosylhydrolase [Victivallales bacterium]|nr:cellulase family glycosylhydrolase [Victivallales bacterium]
MKKIFAWLMLFAVFCMAGTPVDLKLNFQMLTDSVKLDEASRQVIAKVDEQDKAKQNCAMAELDVEALRGRLVFVQIALKAENVSEPQRSWNGMKFMFRYQLDNGQEYWPGAALPRKSYDWRTVSLMAFIPQNAVKLYFYLGLQESSGCASFQLDSLKFWTEEVSVADYRAKYTPTVTSTPVFRGVMSPNPLNLKADDLRTLKEWGANLVRFQIQRNWGKANTDLDLVEYDHWVMKCVSHVESFFPLAKECGIRFVIDLHCLPGGRLENMEMRMFYEQKYADHFVAMWKRIAQRLKGKEAVWAYDLVNEPVMNSAAPFDYWNLQRRAAEAIREVDPEIPIVIESNEWDSTNAFRYLRPLDLPNIIYQAHMYHPGVFTHQGVHKNPIGVRYPGMIQGKKWNIKEVRAALEPVLEFQKKYGVRIYIGKFSAATWAPGAGDYLRDCISVFEEYGWDWSYHAFRESPTWSVELEGPDRDHLKPSQDNPRKAALLEGFRKNRK